MNLKLLGGSNFLFLVMVYLGNYLNHSWCLSNVKFLMDFGTVNF